jgi:hypothetical protein
MHAASCGMHAASCGMHAASCAASWAAAAASSRRWAGGHGKGEVVWRFAPAAPGKALQTMHAVHCMPCMQEFDALKLPKGTKAEWLKCFQHLNSGSQQVPKAEADLRDMTQQRVEPPSVPTIVVGNEHYFGVLDLVRPCSHSRKAVADSTLARPCSHSLEPRVGARGQGGLHSDVRCAAE